MDEEKKDEPKKKPNARSPVRPKNYGQRPPAQNGRAEQRVRYPRISSNHVSRTSNGLASQEMAMQFNQGPSSFRPSESNEASTQTQQNGGPVDQNNWFSPPQGTPAGLNNIGGLQDGPSNNGFHRTVNSQTFGLNDISRLQDDPSNDGFNRTVNSQTFGFNDLGRLQDGPSNDGFHRIDNNQTLGFNDVGRQDSTRPPIRHRTNNGQSPPRRRARRPQIGNTSSPFNASHSPTGSRSFGQASKNSSTRPAHTSHVTSQTADFQNPPVFVPESPQNMLPGIDSTDSFQSPRDIFIPEFDPFSSAARNSGWSPLANLSQDQFLRGMGTEAEPFEFLRPDITVLSDEEIARQLQQEEWESINTPIDHYGNRRGFFSRVRSTLPPIGRAEPGSSGRPHPLEPPVLRRGGQGSRGPGRGRTRSRYERLTESFSREFRDFTPLLVELFHSLEVPDFDLGALMLPGAGLDPNLGEYESLLALAERIGEVNRGLNQTDINSLPTTRFTHQRADDTTASAAVELPQCNICLTEYEEGEELRNLPCSHEFHSGCVDQWLLTNRTCPVCRSEVRQRS